MGKSVNVLGDSAMASLKNSLAKVGRSSPLLL